MAAIKPFYADDAEFNDDADYADQDIENAAMALTEPDLYQGAQGPIGLGSIAPDRIGLGKMAPDAALLAAVALENASLNKTHAGLIRQAWVRRVMWEEIKDRKLELVRAKGTFELQLADGAPLSGPAWNAYPHKSMPRAGLLSWTSKMAAPSFSLPAGGPDVGGSCQGAIAGQTTSTLKQLAKNETIVSRVTGAPVIRNDAVCQHCYATSGNYQYASMAVKQLMLLSWTKQAVAQWKRGEAGNFVDVMSHVIDSADYQLGGASGYNAERRDLPFSRFFRIHDSGDFFNEDYLAAWKAIADNLPDIGFWAPTRIWATTWGNKAVRRINSDQRNFTVRPSIYHVNERPPMSTPLAQAMAAPDSGYAAWTVVYSRIRKPEGNPKDLPETSQVALPEVAMDIPKRARKPRLVVIGEQPLAPPPYNFDCQTYTADKETEAASCRNAKPPIGFDQEGEGCRACWIARDRVVNYTQH